MDEIEITEENIASEVFEENGNKYKIIVELQEDYEHGNFLSRRLITKKLIAHVSIIKNGELIEKYEKEELSEDNFNTLQKIFFRKGVSKEDLIEKVIRTTKENIS